jgi:hypothetical protein
MTQLVLADINVSSCSTLSSANTIYTLNKTIVTTTGCLTINANNITLDGKGYSLVGDGGTSDYGITSSGRTNITIKNFKNISFFGKGILTGSSRSLINNITFINNTYDIDFSSEADSNFTNLTFLKTYSFGMYSTNGVRNKISNITITNSSLYGIYLTIGTTNNSIDRVTTNNTNIGAIVFDGGGSTLLGNNITNFIGNKGEFYGIYLVRALAYLENITIRSYKNYGLILHTSDYTKLKNITAYGCAGSGACINIYLTQYSDFENVYINYSNEYSRAFWINGASRNTSHNVIRNMKIENQLNLDIQLEANAYDTSFYALNNSCINCSYTLAKENVLSPNTELFRKYYYNASVNTTCGVGAGVNVWANVSSLNPTELIVDTTLDIESNWTTTGDGQVWTGYNYLGFWDESGDFASPRLAGTIQPNPQLVMENGGRYTISFNVDTSGSSVGLKFQACGNTFNYPASTGYALKTETFTCSNTNGLNFSSEADAIGKDGMNYAGFNIPMSLKKYQNVTEVNKTTDANGIAILELTNYLNYESNRYYRSNHTVYAYNSSYSNIQNMTTNRANTFNILSCLTSGNCWTKTGTGRGSILFIPRGCVYSKLKGIGGAF